MNEKVKKRSAGRWIRQFAIGLAAGAAIGYFGADYGPALDLDGAHAPGLAVGTMLALVGLIVLAGSLSRRAATGLLSVDLGDEDDFRLERASLRGQGVVAFLAGLELIALSLPAAYLLGPARDILIALLLAGLAVQTWLNLRLWRSGDELFRRIIVEAGLIAFLAFQFLMFFWAAGARFALVADPAALDVYVLLMILYLAGSAIAAMRRGYGAPA